MVYNSEDSIVSVTVGELGDQVHGYYFEWLGQWGNIDFVWWGSGSVCECFVLLAFGAPFDIIFHPFRHGGPPGNSFSGASAKLQTLFSLL